jgi:hypothetical protein
MVRKLACGSCSGNLGLAGSLRGFRDQLPHNGSMLLCSIPFGAFNNLSGFVGEFYPLLSQAGGGGLIGQSLQAQRVLPQRFGGEGRCPGFRRDTSPRDNDEGTRGVFLHLG